MDQLAQASNVGKLGEQLKDIEQGESSQTAAKALNRSKAILVDNHNYEIVPSFKLEKVKSKKDVIDTLEAIYQLKDRFLKRVDRTDMHDWRQFLVDLAQIRKHGSYHEAMIVHEATAPQKARRTREQVARKTLFGLDS